jgi:multidrug efflux pump subunit AcrA (membrane-fusion protein)
MSGTSVTAEEAGVITSVTAEAGTAVSKGDIVAKIAPLSAMRVTASVTADDRKELKAGDKVTIALESDETKTYAGTVRYISELPEEDTETVQYKVTIDFTPDENAVYGMSVVVTTGSKSGTVEEE